MKLNEIINLIRSQDFYTKVFWSGGRIGTDPNFYSQTYKELSEAYQELKKAGALPTASMPEEVQVCAEIEFALGGLCNGVAATQCGQLYRGSEQEKNKALDSINELHNQAIHYFESAMISTNPFAQPRFETNAFKFRITEQLADTYGLIARGCKNLGLNEKAVSAFEQQKTALSQCMKFLPLFDSQKKKNLAMMMSLVEEDLNELKSTSEAQLDGPSFSSATP